MKIRSLCGHNGWEGWDELHCQETPVYAMNTRSILETFARLYMTPLQFVTQSSKVRIRLSFFYTFFLRKKKKNWVACMRLYLHRLTSLRKPHWSDFRKFNLLKDCLMFSSPSLPSTSQQCHTDGILLEEVKDTKDQVTPSNANHSGARINFHSNPWKCVIMSTRLHWPYFGLCWA